jgi:hypothetical protein
MPFECWAQVMGGCDKASGEHVVSKSVIAPKCGCPVITEGNKRAPDGSKSVASLVSKILCVKHNSDLSPLDAEAGRLSDYLARSRNPACVENFEVNGDLLERWLLKTVINMGASGWSDAAIKTKPHRAIVESIFGTRPVPDGCGLYLVDSTDDDMQSDSIFSFTPLHAPFPNGVKIPIGSYVRITGMRFLLATWDKAADQLVYDRLATRVVYRPAWVGITRASGPPLGITFHWATPNSRVIDSETAPLRPT